MSDKLQFVGPFGNGRVAETSDKLKFVGHFLRPFALLPNSPTVSIWRNYADTLARPALRRANVVEESWLHISCRAYAIVAGGDGDFAIRHTARDGQICGQAASL